MAKGNGDTRVSKWRSFSAPLSDDLYYANGARQNFIDLPDDKKKEVREVRKRIEREMKSSLVGKTIEMQLGNGEQPLTVEFTNRGIEHFCNDAMISMSGKYFSENSMKNIDSILKQAKYMPPAVATRPETYTDLAEKYGVKFFNADNLIDPRYGCHAECCGTDFLRNHKVWGGARRSLAHPKGLVLAEHFGKCLCNFTRNSKNAHRTIADMCREYNEREDQRLGQNILGNGI